MNFLPFDSRKIIYKTPFGAVCEGEKVTFNLLLHDDALCSDAFLVFRKDGGKTKFVSLTPSDYYQDGFRFYTTSISFDEGLYWYSFCFDSPWGRQSVTRFYGGKGCVSSDGSPWQLTVFSKGFKTPDSFSGGIIYQIFPDRFYNSGSKKQNVPSDRYIKTDTCALPEHRQNNGSCSLGNDYYCGDLQGIIEKLDYLQSLGVSIIYLNPIFEAHSNHRYNTADYMKIDPLLGTENDLKELCKKADAKGISIVLDGVFSHTGDDSVYFNRQNRYSSVGAYNSEKSPYYNWFRFKKWPDDYHSWWGVPSLPETDEENEEFCEFITGKNGVLRKWLKCGVKGWRLDVADELPDSFLDKIRQCVKSQDKNALIIGEVWEDATNKISYDTRRRYLRGKQLDSVMNYPFANALIGFLTGDDAKNLCETVMSVCENYPKSTVNLLMNHIGTHDTARILTALGGEKANGRSRDWQSTQKMLPEQLNYAKKLLYLAAIIQYTLPGIPSLYYGDEAGVEGYGDPFCRKFYPWGNEDMYLVEFYKKLGQFRRNSACFKNGAFKPVFCDGSIFAFKRESESEKVLVCVNREQVPAFIDIESGWENAEIVFGYLPENNKIRVDGLGFTVLKLHQ